MNERYDDLLASGWNVQGVLFANRVRRALRARLLSLPVGDDDRDALQFARKVLDEVLTVVDAPPQPERVASLVDETRSFRTIRDAWADGVISREKLVDMRDTIVSIATDKPTNTDSVELALDLFARLAAQNLNAVRSAETSSDLDRSEHDPLG